MGSEEKVFIPHLTECWAPAISSGNNSFKLLDPCDVLTTEELKSVKYDKTSWGQLKALPMLSTLPAFENAASVYSPIVDPLEGKDNIAELQFVSEASVVHSIRCRYKKDLIYTDVGRIVIALNPFQSRPDLYNDAQISRYGNADSPYTLSPHVYQIAAGAYKGVMDDGINQSTLITGESGAGKTETTKLLLRFFATRNGHLGQSKSFSGLKASIEDRIVMANPILEAFGNASTSRNPNSSRFGKWIEMYFDARMKIRGASITSYMLEMPRVCEHLHSDRSYHIFYQVVSQKLGGTRGDIQQFAYLTPTPAPPGVVTKGHGKKELVDALKDYEFTSNESSGIFSLAASILYLGNVTFTAANLKGAEGSMIDTKCDGDVKQAASLLGCDETLTIGKETTEVPLKLQDAIGARNSLAKLIYGSLFTWLIFRINGGIRPADEKGLKSIGILDIAGFERFDVNSYEQLLINLSNEKLQQRFNQDIIQAELEDYKKEGLVDLQLDFADNSNILTLIEGKGGIIDILDEELFVPKGTDEGFSSKVTKAHAKAPSFIPSKFSGDSGFSVSHFAGIVPYTASGWLDKNKLTPPREAFETLSSAHNNVVKQMVALIVTDTKKSTVGSNFKKQLEELMVKIRSTQSHYVRCVKPNAAHKPGGIESHEMLRQLKCAGIMEAIKIRKSGFSLRITFADFVDRYAILVGIGKPKTKETCTEIIALVKQKGSLKESDIVIATSKVMARDVVRELLDRMRVEAVEELKRPLLPFIQAYESAIETQKGMFLYPSQILPDVATPESLEKKRKMVAAGLEEVEKKLGTLENPPGWVGTAILIETAMKREIEVVTMAVAALDRVKPLSIGEAEVKSLETVKHMARDFNVINVSVEKVGRVLDLIYEEKDWVSQLSSPDTDCEGLVQEIKASSRDILTPACHKMMAEVIARIDSAKAAKAKEQAEAEAAKAKKKAEEESRRAVQEAESRAMNMATAARQSSEVITRADTILQKNEPMMPPPKKLISSRSPSIGEDVGRKANIAKMIPKKSPTVKAANPLAVAPRAKAKAAPARNR